MPPLHKLAVSLSPLVFSRPSAHCHSPRCLFDDDSAAGANKLTSPDAIEPLARSGPFSSVTTRPAESGQVLALTQDAAPVKFQ